MPTHPTPCDSPCPSVASVVKKTPPEKHNTRRLTPTARLNTHQHHHPFVSVVSFVVASPPHPTPRDFPCPSVAKTTPSTRPQHPIRDSPAHRKQSVLHALLACPLHTHRQTQTTYREKTQCCRINTFKTCASVTALVCPSHACRDCRTRLASIAPAAYSRRCRRIRRINR